MTGKKSLLLTVVLGLIAGTAALLGYLSANQKLGKPGVIVVSEPVYNPDGKVVARQSAYLPETVLDYTSRPLPVTALELGWLPRDTTYGRRGYKPQEGVEITASIVLMGKDRTSIHKPQYCLTGQGWRIDDSETTTIRVERPQPYDLPVMKLTATGAFSTAAGERITARGIYVYWFVADHELTADHLERMWWMARDLIRNGTLQRWAYVSCFSTCLPGQEAATFQRMKEFIAASVPEFQLTTGAVSTKVSSFAPPKSM
jgi:hypothetical protein